MSTVQILDQSIRKPYLGGWRHTVTGAEYFNADSQTGPSVKRVPWDQMCSRPVQVVQTKEESTQIVRNSATQMWRPDHYISSYEDKILIAKTYLSYTELFKIIDESARIIQRNYRAYKTRQRIRECAEKYRRMLEECIKRFQKKDLLRERQKEEISNAIRPKVQADFDALYSLIETWLARQNNGLKCSTKSYRLAANYSLILGKKVNLLNEVGRHRQRLQIVAFQQTRLGILRKNCQSTVWRGYKDKKIEMITLRTQLAREYKTLYDDLVKDTVNVSKRMEILCRLKESLKMHNCKKIDKLIYLINQETVLIQQGIKFNYLVNLRARIQKKLSLKWEDEVTNVYFKTLPRKF